jgi:hypothetical protein
MGDQAVQPVGFIGIQPAVQGIGLTGLKQAVKSDPMRGVALRNLEEGAAAFSNIGVRIMSEMMIQLLTLPLEQDQGSQAGHNSLLSDTADEEFYPSLALSERITCFVCQTSLDE